MIELTFYDFHEHYYDICDEKFPEEFFQLYMMKNGLGDVLYVGISTTDVWGRWFGWGGHILWDGGRIYGESPIGAKIEKHLPDSLQWKIQLWTLKDCLEYCLNVLPEDRSGLTIKDVEPFMIQKIRPALNIHYNTSPGKDTTPKSKREIDLEERVQKAYDEILNRKGR